MRNAYEIELIKHFYDISTLVIITWVYGKPNENICIEQSFEGDSITFKQLQALISEMDEAVKRKQELV
jgi:hypothetical protein